ncbi:hypothetical protein [Streptomyces chumphonensis]|uniref:hypothetical protein n=1 Tax=Streptomyces chumphonensis TaxID=1214925 RepID=UPI003D74B029
MARLQILELPEGVDDARAPFVLVVDQCENRWVSRPGDGDALASELWQQAAQRLGARGAVVTPETVEIPANEVPVGPDGYPVRLRVEADLDGFREQVAEAREEAQRKLSDSETLGHELLQRAENAEGRSRAMEVQRNRANRRAEIAEAAAANAKELMGRRTRTLRERAERAERSERDLLTHIEESRSRDVERMDQVTDALGLDRLRDWDEIVRALRVYRGASELYAETRTVKGGE